MNTGNVSGSTGSGATAAYYQNLKSSNEKPSGSDGSKPAAEKPASDVYTSSGSKDTGAVYTKSSVSMSKLQNMANARFASMRGAVESLIGGLTGGSSQAYGFGQAFWAMSANGTDFENYKVDAATQEKAQELISEDGYFGVKKTTERIMDFAKAMAGEGADEKTIENLRKGAQAGFDSVADLFGGFDKLPDVTKETYDAVMKAFDDWTAGTKITEA